MKQYMFLFFVLIFPNVSFAEIDLVGNSPLYVPIESCSEHAREVIRQSQIPYNVIHSCSTNKQHLGGELVNLIHIEYGDAQDCLSGCFYENIYVITPDDLSYIKRLPPPTKWLTSTMSSLKPFWDPKPVRFECSPISHENIKFRLKQWNDQIGWELTLGQPQECTWFEIEKTTMTYDYEPIHTGHLMKRSLSGSVFVYMDEGDIQWNFDNIRMDEMEIQKHGPSQK